MPTRHFIIQGRVQGVGFRYFVKSTAVRLGLTGWVRNLPGGEVECQATGATEKLAELENRLREGPPMSHVTNLHKEDFNINPDPEIRDFRITY